MPRRLIVLTAIGWLVAACFATPSATPQAGPSASEAIAAPEPTAAPVRRPIVIDTDLDHSDIAAILVLLRDPAVEVRGIAIDGTGLVHCQGGRLVMRYLLDEMGVPDIPFGCGRVDGGPDATPFPEDWRAAADRGYGFVMTPKVESGAPKDAVDILTAAIKDGPTPPLLVTLGPLTNLEDAFAADPTLVQGIAGIHAMLGTIDAPGNVYLEGHGPRDPLEWNAFADPSAVAAVLATDVPITLIPLDATDDVPVPADLAVRVSEDRSAAGADLMHELFIRNPARLDASEGQQLWDELAALTVGDPGLVTWDEATVVAGQDGRLTRDAQGRSVRYARAADAPAVGAALIDGLRRGAPRQTPFAMTGETTASWDGSTCALTTPLTRAGVHTLRLDNTSGAPGGVMLVTVEAPHTWADLEAFLDAFDAQVATSAQPPRWVHLGAGVMDETGVGTEASALADVSAGTVGIVCIAGNWPELTFTLSVPTEVGAAP